MGLSLLDENGAMVQAKIPNVPQFLHRLLSVKTDRQNQVFELFESRLVEAVEYARQQGIFDEGLQTLRAQSIVKTRDDVVYTHKTGAATRYVELNVTNAIEYLSWEEVSAKAPREAATDVVSGWYVSAHGKHKGRVFYLSDRGTRLNSEGVETHRGVLYGIRKGAHRYIDNAQEIARGTGVRNVGGAPRVVQLAHRISAEEAERRWNEELAQAPATETQTKGMLVGAILPIWDRVTGSEIIYRLQTDDGEQLLGRLLGGRAAKETLRNLGIDDGGVSKLSARELFEAVQGGQKAVLSNGWEIVRSKVNHEQRIEIRRGAPFSAAEIDILKEQGAFVERINWAQRVFLPVGEEGLRAFERITAAKPVVELFEARAPETVAAASALPSMGVRESGPSSMALPDDARRDAPRPTPSRAPAEPQPAPRVSVARPNRGAPSHKRLAATLIAQLEAGTAPWQQTWAPGALRLPHNNPVTGTRYRGANALWLAMQGRGDQRWMTYEQARRTGAQVRHGERGTQVQFWKLRDRMPVQDDSGQPLRDAKGNPVYRTIQLDRPKVFTAVVFNAEQIDGLPPLEVTAPAPDRHMRAEALLTASGADIRHDQGEHLFYRPATDRIHLPAHDRFQSADSYYAAGLHELGHWTGHPSRLDRDLAHPFGSEGYAKEGLRAGISSLMLGDQLGIGHEPGRHASYIDAWVKVLQDDPTEILRAARDAERIADHLLAFEKERPQAPEIQRPGTEPLAPVRAGEGRGNESKGTDGTTPTRPTPRRLSDLTVREGAEALAMTQRLDDLARNLGQLFDKPAARMEMVRHTTPSARDRTLAEVLGLEVGDAHSLTNRMHERRPRDMTREEVEAGLKAFPPLLRAVEEIRERYPDAVPVALRQPPERARPAKAKSPARAAGGRAR